MKTKEESETPLGPIKAIETASKLVEDDEDGEDAPFL